MIVRQIKLKLNSKQESMLSAWIWHLTAVYNWGIKKIENDARNYIYYSKNNFQNLLANHSRKLGIPSHTLQGTLIQAYIAWQRCFKKLAKKPRLKGNCNKLNSIAFPDPFQFPKENRINIPGLGSVRYHKQKIPKACIKSGRIIKRASGWYLCLWIDANPNKIIITGDGQIGIDPGFKTLLTLSTGEKIEHPRELEYTEIRICQAQRGHNKKLTARIHEHIGNQRKDRNHKLSRRLVSENKLIVFSADHHQKIARNFGKSVSSSGHYQLQQMLFYKSSSCGRKYVEVDSRNSTKTCSVCGALNGPTGWNGLVVRHWVCACGAQHDRDINAAINTLYAGAGVAHERELYNIV
jgi:putative transposase